MIQAYHEAGIGVIADVVYNHTYSSYSSPFQLSVPAYYYRMHDNGAFQDGSGCETKRPVKRKCIANT